jgi:cellulose synthase/poly-beta-1,6-N-acetylglucosamine synthase-like glycosyltransferase
LREFFSLVGSTILFPNSSLGTRLTQDHFVSILFFISVSLILYVYAGYPVLLLIMRRVRGARQRVQKAIEPPVTLMISAYNEEKIIAQKIENSLALDYPKDKLEIIVISDKSSDATDEVVRSFADAGVKLVQMPERGGKTAGLNRCVPQAKGEIIIFSDANAMYDKQVVRKIARNFADETVGAVTGESRYNLDEGDTSTASENLYWRYELALKRLESEIGSLVGGDGAIYAIRKKCYRQLQPSDLSDFVNPLQIIAQGYRNVYEEEAFSYEKGGESFEKEFRRKVRIVNRAWRGMMSMRHLLNPFRFGFFAIQAISHKLLRWLVPCFMALAFVSNFFLIDGENIFKLILFLQIAFYFFALIGMLRKRQEHIARIFYLPYYFCLVNWASLQGILENYLGKTYTVWRTVRER